MKNLLLLFVCFCLLENVFAVPGDTLHVIPHNKTLMKTDPARGTNEVRKWAVFPSSKTNYRKIIANITLQCPDGMKCGAWDYIDYVILRKKGSEQSQPLNLEMVRMLTPYGGWFDSTWKFTWQQDVTDWGLLLRDSVEIEYQHTGYESNDGIGWLVTLDFAIIEGSPVMNALGHQTLWSGSFAYGDSSKPFETLVKPVSLDMPKGARIANYRVVQTGHGMDAPDGCSEFCSKWRETYFDNQKLDHKDMYIVCGNNPVFPQAGTWVYSRGNWCPGSLAIPDVYTLPLKGNKHTVDLKMQPYHSTKPQGGWAINAHAFYYGSPNSEYDVTINDVIAPSNIDEYGRMNPVCGNARIHIQNNGSKALRTLNIAYGVKGAKKMIYKWTGNLAFLQSTEIVLPGNISTEATGDFVFEVTLSSPNGKKDQYALDNSVLSYGKMPPAMESEVIVSFMPNKDSTQTGWELKDASGQLIKAVPQGAIHKAGLRNDTLHLSPGCYVLNITDTANDGLSFWANPKGGYGYIQILDKNGKLLQNFDPNFGSGIQYYFTVKEGYVADRSSIQPVFEFFPARTKGPTSADIVIDEPQDITFKFTDEKGKLQWESTYHNFSSKFIKMDLSSLPASFYTVDLYLANGKHVRRSIRKVD